ncbi:MAG: DinB family protein [Anaerolineae bacterium]
MKQKELITLFEYNYWATDKILSSANGLEQAELLAKRAISYGSILGLLSHIFNAEAMWLNRCRDGVSPSTVRYEQSCPSLTELSAEWQTERQQFFVYLQTLDKKQLEAPIKYKGFSGREFENTLWHILMQIVNHGVNHRSEIAGILTELRHPPGDLDFLIYLRN